MVVPGTPRYRRLSRMFDPRPMGAIKITLLMFLLMFSILALTIRWMNTSIFSGLFQRKIVAQNQPQPPSKPINYCTSGCPKPQGLTIMSSSTESCPEYFKWIHEDLKPWKATGITRDMVERGQKLSHIRIVIIKGRLYVKKFKTVFQTRDIVTIWGILQLLKLYPGRVPDLDLYFECNDKPVVKKSDYDGNGGSNNASMPPPVFHYCGEDSSYDIVFPDWSFWGWPELNIKPWGILKETLKESNNKTKWVDREPYAYWKGNAHLGLARQNLVKCNVSDKKETNARIYNMVWKREVRRGFKTSDLANQCTHRYKVYVEGIAWSVSEKYILACDSMTLLVAPQYYDFFTRSLLPLIHYWPIKMEDMCRSIKFAVDWANSYTEKAQKIGKAGSKFIQEELRMKFVYDYMFHLLSEYGKLLKYEPTIPKGAREVCSEKMMCNAKGLFNKFRKQSWITSPADTSACSMPPPFDNKSLKDFIDRKESLTQLVESLT